MVAIQQQLEKTKEDSLESRVKGFLGEAGEQSLIPVEGPAVAPVVAETRTPAMISSEAGIKEVDKLKEKEAQLTPIPVEQTEEQRAAAIRDAGLIEKEGELETAPLTLMNEDGQEVTFNDPTINQSNIQSFLNRGFDVTSGALPTGVTAQGAEPIDTQASEAQAKLQQEEQDLEDSKNKLRNLNVINDPAFLRIADGITSIWDDRIAKRKQIEASRQASLGQAGIRLGSRFTGPTFEGILASSERDSLDKISSLEQQKVAALTNAQLAFREQKWDEYSDLVNLAEKDYERQLEEVEKLNEVAIKQNEELAEEAEKVLSQGAIISTIGSGIIDPIDIFNSINFDEQGNFTGLVDFDDITNVTTKIQTTEHPASAAIREYTEAIEFGIVPPGTSFVEYLDIKNPARKLDLIKKGLDIQKTQQDLTQASSELTPKQMSTAIQLTNSLKGQPSYTDMLDIKTGMTSVSIGLSQQNGFGDITAINGFQRMVDPGATVRSEDVVLLQSASAFIQKVLSDFPFEKLAKGSKLPDPVRKQMMKVASDLYETRASNYNDETGQQYKNLAGGANIPFKFIGVDFPEKASEFGLQVAITPQEKTDALDNFLSGGTEDFTGIIDTTEENFGDEFLSVFGLETKN